MKFILGQKIGMTQMFGARGQSVPVSVLEVRPNIVVALRSLEQDGYEAVALGYGARRRASASRRGQFAGLLHIPRFVREFRDASSKFQRGDEVSVAVFAPGERVRVSGISKAKGFQGVVKRHGFGGGPKSHGQKDRLRAPGSIGSSFPEHVSKGKRMAGRMGGERVTVKYLEVVRVDPERYFLYVRGAVPGRRGTLLEIRAPSP